MRIISSQPSFMPRFSAAIEGCRIQSCRRCDGFVVMLLDLVPIGRKVRISARQWNGQGGGARKGALKERSSVHEPRA